MKKLLVALALLILCAGVPMAQTRETSITITKVFTDPDADLKNGRGKPEEMKGLTKVVLQE